MHEADKDKLIEELRKSFHVTKISKAYEKEVSQKKEGSHKRIHMSLNNK